MVMFKKNGLESFEYQQLEMNYLKNFCFNLIIIFIYILCLCKDFI